MKTTPWMLPSLAALALGACSGGGGGGGGAMTPPPTGSGNTAPTIAKLAPSSVVLQNGSSEPIPFEVSDAQSAAAQLEVSVQSSNADLMPAAGIELGGNASTRTLLFTPEPGKAGTADITVAVRDPDGLTATQTMSLQVTTQEESFRQFALSAIGADPQAQPAEVAGHSWIDTAEEDPQAFDAVLSSIAE